MITIYQIWMDEGVVETGQSVTVKIFHVMLSTKVTHESRSDLEINGMPLERVQNFNFPGLLFKTRPENHT